MEASKHKNNKLKTNIDKRSNNIGHNTTQNLKTQHIHESPKDHQCHDSKKNTVTENSQPASVSLFILAAPAAESR
jgi:hypothetical protein